MGNNVENAQNSSKAYVELKNINKNFGDFKATDNVSFTVEKGKLVGLLGPSGSGKTTILRILAGLETADSGEIYIGGKLVNKIPASKRGIGFVFQSYALFRYKTVFENIAFGLVIEKRKKSEIKERVMELINLVGLKGMENRFPNQLSGGQRQRVAFARALAVQPQLLLLDEPFAAIDAKVRQELRLWLKELITRVGITSIFVTHDQDEAIEVADQIIITNKGRIEQSGTPIEIYREPETAFVSKFIGHSMELSQPDIFNGFKSVQHEGSAVIRPEFITVSKLDEKLEYEVTAENGIVQQLFFRGTDIEVKVLVKDVLLTAYRPINYAPVEIGEKVKVFISRLYFIDGNKALTVENESISASKQIYMI